MIRDALRKRHLGWLVGLALSWLGLNVGACGEDPEAIAVCSGHTCPKACTDLKGTDCDIRSPSCRERIFKAVECVRGTPGELPEVRLLTEDEVRAERKSKSADVERDASASDGGDAGIASDGGDAGTSDASDESTSDGGDAGTSHAGDEGTSDGGDAGTSDGGDAAVVTMDPSEEEQRHWGRALEMLGLRLNMPTMDNVDSLAGVYRSATRSITLVDRGEPLDSPAMQTTLAHELVHALQDQTVGLAETRRGRSGTTDAALAMGCLTEGEAVLYEELSWALMQGWDVDETYWDRIFANQAKYNRDAVVAADSPYDMSWLLRYGVGARYLADAWLAGGSAEVARFYDAPPTSSVQWMLGYADAQQRATPLALPLGCILATTPAGFERVSSDVFGAFVVYAFLAHNLVMDHIAPAERSWQQALAWRQDRVELFANSVGETAVSWRIRFADEATAVAVQGLLVRQLHVIIRVLRHGSEVEVRAAEGGNLADWSPTDPANCPAVE